MRLERLGAFHQTRLSFMRALLRRLKAEHWRFDRPLWTLDDKGVGVALYRARGSERIYSLICFAHDLDPTKRTDRVIAEEWDATFVLFDGEPGEADIARLQANVPKQEAGRCLASEIVMSRANKSVRLFEHVVACLVDGRQPAAADLDAVGYLMRTTAVYGNGKFGLADREAIADRPELVGPFRAEMLTVWLIRAFTVDLAEHMARVKGQARAVRLDPNLRRRLGVGNATGLGMAPFLVHHPALIHRWILARETALGRVRSLEDASPDSMRTFRRLLLRAKAYAMAWNVPDAVQTQHIEKLRADLDRLTQAFDSGEFDGNRPWDAIYRRAEAQLSLEAQELVVSLLIEPQGDVVDDLADQMAVDEGAGFRIDGAVRQHALKELIARNYGWALPVEYAQAEHSARFWYVSEEKLEPRLGERWEEPGGELEQPLAVGRDVARLWSALDGADASQSVADLLLRMPEHRHIVRRVQSAARSPYAEIRDNLIDSDMRPIDLLRCKLSFFGATRFDPKSDRWVRITMFQFAPFPDELAGIPADDWFLPPL